MRKRCGLLVVCALVGFFPISFCVLFCCLFCRGVGVGEHAYVLFGLFYGTRSWSHRITESTELEVASKGHLA